MLQNDLCLASKPRYEILDGLRGVAAMMVIVFHCFETYIPLIGTQIINHGYLAVDFFFILSGFVIGYAYNDRWNSMTTWGFFKRRLVRLHPMVVAGTLWGAALFFFAAGNYFPAIIQTPAWKFGLCIWLALLMIPCPTGLDIRGWGETNPLNGPNWSLTFEYIGNILYALILRRLPVVVLGILCLCSIFFTLDLTLGWDVFHLLPHGPQYTVIGGWSITPDQLYIGFTRLGYPFLCGLLLSRILPARMLPSNPSGSHMGIRGGFWWTSIMLVIIFSMPMIGRERGFADGLYQAVCIIVLFPVVVLIGAGSKTTDKRSKAWCELLGAVSYPLYITHYPLMYMQMAWFERHKAAPLWIHISVNVGVVLVSVCVAWAFLKLYDEPTRAWLTKKVLRRR